MYFKSHCYFLLKFKLIIPPFYCNIDDIFPTTTSGKKYINFEVIVFLIFVFFLSFSTSFDQFTRFVCSTHNYIIV